MGGLSTLVGFTSQTYTFEGTLRSLLSLLVQKLERAQTQFPAREVILKTVAFTSL